MRRAKRVIRDLLATTCGVLWLASAGASAQDAPARSVRLLVPSAPGGPADFAGRLIATGVGEALGRYVVVVPLQDANGVAAMEAAARAAPDGYTLAIGNLETHVFNVGLRKALPYDPVRDFAPVSRLISAGAALVANATVTPATFKDFVAAVRKSPGGRYRIAMVGASGRVPVEALMTAAGISLSGVPYKGGSSSEVAALSGEVDVALLPLSNVVAQVQSGRLKAYGVTSLKRSPLLPEVPTLQEQGLPGYEYGSWHGLFAPRDTPQHMVRAMHKAVTATFQKPEVRDVVIARGAEIVAGTPEELAAHLAREIARYREIIKRAGIEPK